MTEETQTQEESPINITIQDLTLFANIIDLAVQRGAFKGAEAETVGAAFSKLVNIVKALTPPQEEGEQPEAADAE
jgi:hypothetical protein